MYLTKFQSDLECTNTSEYLTGTLTSVRSQISYYSSDLFRVANYFVRTILYVEIEMEIPAGSFGPV